MRNSMLARSDFNSLVSKFCENDIQVRQGNSKNADCSEEMTLLINMDNRYNTFIVQNMIDESECTDVIVENTSFKRIETKYGYILIRFDEITDFIVIVICVYNEENEEMGCLSC